MNTDRESIRSSFICVHRCSSVVLKKGQKGRASFNTGMRIMNTAGSRQQAVDGSRYAVVGSRCPTPPCPSASSVVKKGIGDWGLGISKEKSPVSASPRLRVKRNVLASSRLCVFALKSSPRPRVENRRRGVLLLIVLALLALFALIAVTFVILSTHEQRAAESQARVERYADPPDKLLNEALLQVFRGSNCPSSVL